MTQADGGSPSVTSKSGARKRTLSLIGIGVSLVVVAAVLFVVLRPDPAPDPVADQFAAAWSDDEQTAFENLLIVPETLQDANPFELVESVQAVDTTVVTSVVDEVDDETIATFEVSVELVDDGIWSWETDIPMVFEDDEWKMVWSPEAFHPNFGLEHTISKTTAWPERAPILAVDGQELVSATEEILIGIQPSRLNSREEAADVLEEQFGVEAEAIDEALDAPGVEPDHFVNIIQVRKSDFEQVRDIVFPVPGLVFRDTTGRGTPIPDLATQVVGSFGEITAERLEELGAPYGVGDAVGLSGLEAAYEDQLAGRPSITIEIVSPDELVTEIVEVAEEVAPEPLETTIDIELQQAAEEALAATEASGAFVAVDSATGEIRASASSPVDEGFNRAFNGAYPPGSTFKIVTATAILGEGITPDTTVGCPATIEVEGKTFANFEDSALGSVPFSRAFAESCNTAMIDQAAQLPDGSLDNAAQTFGFGVDYTVGLPVVGGSFPASTSAADEAAASIGQSSLTVSPLHMATVASAAIEGTWRSPILIPANHGEQVIQELPSEAAAQLPGLMREVVLNGSGVAANVANVEVRGKSGTAEYGEGDPLPTHAWFVAEANGLGMAVIIEDGSSGGAVAAPVVADFVAAVS